ncbi:unnamed protein product [Rhizophagus irregularis]|nr:unnamed protein product [Rhizophagus irregularis]
MANRILDFFNDNKVVDEYNNNYNDDDDNDDDGESSKREKRSLKELKSVMISTLRASSILKISKDFILLLVNARNIIQIFVKNYQPLTRNPYVKDSQSKDDVDESEVLLNSTVCL